MKTGETVLLGSAHVTAVDHVEDLEEDERVENEGEAAHLVSIEGGRIVVFVIKVEDCSVGAHNDHHDADHAESTTDDLTVHERSHDVALTGSESLDFFNGLRGGEGEGTEDIHDEVDVDELDRVEDGLLSHAEADHDDNQNGKVARDLELEETLDVHEDVTAPHDSSHGRVEVIGAQDHASAVAGNRGSTLESEADVSSLEGLDIIDALTNNCDAPEFRLFFFAGIHALEACDEDSLGLGVSTADHAEVSNDASELSLIGQRVVDDRLAALLTNLGILLDFADKLFELITIHSDVASITTLNNLELLWSKNANIGGNSSAGKKIVAGDKDQVDARVTGVLDDFLNVGAGRVLEGDRGKESLILALESCNLFRIIDFSVHALHEVLEILNGHVSV